MAEHAEERRLHREQIQIAVRETPLLAQWQEAPGVSTAAAMRISDDEGPLAFATVELIKEHPEFEDYFREQAGIPKKRIQQQVKGKTRNERTQAWVGVVNSVCAHIVRAKNGWDTSYHERLAASCRAVSMDGTMRNCVGQDARESTSINLMEKPLDSRFRGNDGE